MSTRLAAFDDIDQLREEVDSGGLEWFITLEPQPVYLTLSDEWVIVTPPEEEGGDPIITRTLYGDLNTVTADQDAGLIPDDGTILVTTIATVDPYESTPYIGTPTCGPVLASTVSTANVGGLQLLKRLSGEVEVFSAIGGGSMNTPNVLLTADGTGVIAIASNGSGRADNPEMVRFTSDANPTEVWRYTLPGGAGSSIPRTLGDEPGAMVLSSTLAITTGRSNAGLSASDVNHMIAVNLATGTLAWSLESNGASSLDAHPIVSEAHNRVIHSNVNGWVGTGTNRVVMANLATGAIVDHEAHTTMGFSDYEVWGAVTGDTLILSTGGSGDGIVAHDMTLDDLAQTPLWSLSKTGGVDFTNTVPTDVLKAHTLSDGRVCFASTSTVTSPGVIFFVDAAGDTAEVTLDLSEIGSSPSILDTAVDPVSGDLWVMMGGNTRTRYARLPAPYTADVVDQLAGDTEPGITIPYPRNFDVRGTRIVEGYRTTASAPGLISTLKVQLP